MDGLRLFAVIASSLLLALANLSPAYAAVPAERHVASPRAVGSTDDPLAACVSAARATPSQTSWTCVGGELTTVTPVNSGAPEVKRTMIAESTFVASPAVSDPQPAGMAPPVDDYDTWCETKPGCGRRVVSSGSSLYIAEVKGNGAYGVGSSVIGTFDQVLRGYLNGTQPNWRGTLIWDSGPRIYPQTFYIDCRKSDRLGDGRCGGAPWEDPLFIDSTNRYTWFPNRYDYRSNSQNTTQSGRYHDDYYGSFEAQGYEDRSFSTGVLHTGRWSNCDNDDNCRYYQVPWNKDPDA